MFPLETLASVTVCSGVLHFHWTKGDVREGWAFSPLFSLFLARRRWSMSLSNGQLNDELTPAGFNDSLALGEVSFIHDWTLWSSYSGGLSWFKTDRVPHGLTWGVFVPQLGVLFWEGLAVLGGKG